VETKEEKKTREQPKYQNETQQDTLDQSKKYYHIIISKVTTF
jgi:hypothetical protein